MNTSITILLTALLPVAILAFYIYRRDKNSPEPMGQLAKAFFFGVLSVPLSLAMSIPFGLVGLYPQVSATVFDSVRESFFGAAIPEEIAKFAMLWLVLRNNRYFDEKMDGIVYSVCVTLGFAAFENVMYLFSNPDSFLEVGVARAIFAVPGHFCDGVLMGYYYSLAKFYPKCSTRNKALVLAAPIFVHGLYDTILTVMNVTPAISGILMVIFIVFCFRLWKYASKSIREHLSRDGYCVPEI